MKTIKCMGMRLLFITTGRFISINGITSVIMNYYRNIDKSDMTIDFVVPNHVSDDLANELKSGGSHIYELSRKNNPVFYFYELLKLLKEKHYDIVHVHGSSSLMALDLLPSFFCGVPMRVAHSHNTSSNYKIIHMVLKPLFHCCCNYRLACGEEAGKWLFGKRRFTVLRNGIETGKYKYNQEVRECLREYYHIKDKYVVGHVGHFFPVKNHSFMIEWFNELVKKNDKFYLILVSEGPLFNDIKKKVKEYEIEDNVLFIGKSSKVHELLQAFDVFVLPSLHEGLPVSLIEAQAAGLDCIVSDHVTKEANLTGNIRYLPITETGDWVGALEKCGVADGDDRMEKCLRNQELIRDAGYDSVSNAHILKEIYTKFLTEHGDKALA